MGRWSEGRSYRGAMRDLRAAKRREAVDRNKDTDPKNRSKKRRRRKTAATEES